VLCKKPARNPGPAPTVPKVVIAGTVERPLPECRIPISPRAALLRSLALPGWGQFSLDRRKAGWMFVGAETGSLFMVAKSKHDLDQATSARNDSIFGPVTDAAGNPQIDPATGKPKMAWQAKNKNLADRIKARRTHLEDWIAAIVFNHLFSGADAWVAANLADFDANVKVTSLGSRGVSVAARVAW
jgi:hypothetical protein